MKASYLLSMLMLSMSIVACARAEPTPTPTHELTVPNFLASNPACVVKVPVDSSQCTSEGCTLPAPAGSMLDSIKLNFSCLPKSSPTGFEKPVPEAKVQSLPAKNARGLLMLIDDVDSPPNERFRDLSFCLYGKLNNFCGYAKVISLEYRTKINATSTVKAFIQGIELLEPPTTGGN